VRALAPAVRSLSRARKKHKYASGAQGGADGTHAVGDAQGGDLSSVSIRGFGGEPAATPQSLPAGAPPPSPKPGLTRPGDAAAAQIALQPHAKARLKLSEREKEEFQRLDKKERTRKRLMLLARCPACRPHPRSCTPRRRFAHHS
jgi:hypothetical protein